MVKYFLPLTVFLFSQCLSENQQFSSGDLQGVWAENEDENAVFVIDGDSLFFVDHLDRQYEYKISKDTLKFNGDDGLIWYNILKLSKDSLILRNEVGYKISLYNRG